MGFAKGGNGGSGAKVSLKLKVNPGDVFTAVAGSGGAGAVWVNVASGTYYGSTGGQSSFGKYIAYGGGGGGITAAGKPYNNSYTVITGTQGGANVTEVLSNAIAYLDNSIICGSYGNGGESSSYEGQSGFPGGNGAVIVYW